MEKIWTAWRVLGEHDARIFTTLAVQLEKPATVVNNTALLLAALEAIAAGETSFQAEYQRFYTELLHYYYDSEARMKWLYYYFDENNEYHLGGTDEAGDGSFTFDGETYLVKFEWEAGTRPGYRFTVRTAAGEELRPELRTYSLAPAEEGWRILDASGQLYAQLSLCSFKPMTGANNLPPAWRDAALAVIRDMEEKNEKSRTVTLERPASPYLNLPAAADLSPEIEIDINQKNTGEYVLRGSTLSLNEKRDD